MGNPENKKPRLLPRSYAISKAHRVHERTGVRNSPVNHQTKDCRPRGTFSLRPLRRQTQRTNTCRTPPESDPLSQHNQHHRERHFGHEPLSEAGD